MFYQWSTKWYSSNCSLDNSLHQLWYLFITPTLSTLSFYTTSYSLPFCPIIVLHFYSCGFLVHCLLHPTLYIMLHFEPKLSYLDLAQSRHLTQGFDWIKITKNIQNLIKRMYSCTSIFVDMIDCCDRELDSFWESSQHLKNCRINHNST